MWFPPPRVYPALRVNAEGCSGVPFLAYQEFQDGRNLVLSLLGEPEVSNCDGDSVVCRGGESVDLFRALDPDLPAYTALVGLEE